MKSNKSREPLRIAFSLLVTILVITSCSLFYLYREIHELPGMQWPKASSQTFEFELQTEEKIGATVLFRHVEGYRFDNVEMRIVAQHEEITWLDTLILIPIKNETGDYLGEGAVDIWDVEFQFLENKPLGAGAHQFDISHNMKIDPLPLVMEIGLALKKQE